MIFRTIMAKTISLKKLQIGLLYESKARDLAIAAEKFGGNFKLMATECDLTVQQINRYYKTYPEFKEVVDNAREATYQKVLGKLEELIDDGNMQAITLFLTRSPWAKSAGWAEKVETDSTVKLSDTEKAQRAKEILGI